MFVRDFLKNFLVYVVNMEIKRISFLSNGSDCV